MTKEKVARKSNSVVVNLENKTFHLEIKQGEKVLFDRTISYAEKASELKLLGYGASQMFNDSVAGKDETEWLELWEEKARQVNEGDFRAKERTVKQKVITDIHEAEKFCQERSLDLNETTIQVLSSAGLFSQNLSEIFQARKKK